MPEFADIHCHLLPGLDDGAGDLSESLAMAVMAVADGTRTIIATPHQLGSFSHNGGDAIRTQTAELQRHLDRAGNSLRVLPGADVRIEDGMVERLVAGEVLTLGDHGRHVLLELPHELCFPLGELLKSLAKRDMVGILSHPERNAGLIRERRLVLELVDAGCLMQVTAGSFLGAFGPKCQELAEWMLGQGLIHFVATDAHGVKARRPLMGRTFERVRELVGEDAACALCCDHPIAVAAGRDVVGGRREVRPGRWRGLFKRQKAA